MDLAVALGAVTAGLTVTIDGRVYRPVAVNASAQLVIVGPGVGGAHVVTATDLDIRNLTKALDELYAVLRTDAGAAYDARDRNWTVTETVPVSQATPDSLRVGVYGRYSGAWVRQPLAFGFSAVYAEEVSNVNAAAGTNTLTSAAVPANTLRVIQGISGKDRNTGPANVRLHTTIGGVIRRAQYAGAKVLDVDAIFRGPFYLAAADTWSVLLDGCALNDDIYANAWGYDMTLNL